ncbi:sulfite exporter TauE/SafE family protein [Pseudonocardia parietis]|uniref:Probable membrane transporter protein n=1 Tax=Pseudonocardia parietis TaxID=570936 RepID=A0ABS4VKU0_9PSEU|nr:sulfite exporter TauE/SafE family protein [Pseudonocardia parietis]MBP2364544.1 putative membrane protein YfcA [Pseudonocardia parietis]
MIGVLSGALGLVVGLVIGTLGGGGGVLSVPALVYLLGQDARAATTGSIVIVGLVSAVGMLTRLRGRVIDWRTGLAFGVVGIPAAWAGALLNRTVPQPALLLSFSVLTLAIAVLLLVRSSSTAREDTPPATGATGSTGVLAPPDRRSAVARAVKVIASAAVVGFMTGFLGVGGGFLVVPALAIVLGMTMPAAIATSLLVLTLNAAGSLAARAGHLDLDWAVLGPFVGVAVLGALAGKPIADRMSSAALGRAFAVLLLGVGGFVGVESLLSLV